MTAHKWRPDQLLDGYESFSWTLDDVVPAEGEPPDLLTATLVRRISAPRRAAVLYVHGWSDYFFQTHVADFFDSLGYDFYALELRRYGRNLRAGLLAGYITDLDDYALELDEAIRLIRAEHDIVVLMGHSTGGLITSLWASRHQDAIDGLILNAPWLDMAGSPALWHLTQSLLTPLSAMSPTRSVSVPDLGFSRRALHKDADGEWDFDLTLKANFGFVMRFAWVQAILRGHNRVDAGLGIDLPVLCLSSAKSKLPKGWDETLLGVDFVLDVTKIAAAVHKLGRHVTLVQFEGALHDVTLSAKPVRERVFAELGRWLGAYLPK